VERLGAKFVLVIPPDKAVIYPEFLPDWLRRRGDRTRLHWFVDAVRGTGMDILYLKDALLAGKKEGDLYYKTDVHWSNLGAFLGAAAIVDHLRSLDQRVRPFLTSRYDRQPYRGEVVDGGPPDLGILLGLPFWTVYDEHIVPVGGWTTKEQFIYDGRYQQYLYTKDAPELPTLVVYRDSFGYPIRRFVAEHFRRALFVDTWTNVNSVAGQFPGTIVERERPDFFIYERWEDGVLQPTANPPEVAAGGGGERTAARR
jgi:alginate O-acetyltransferase complex protein AlgJ